MPVLGVSQRLWALESASIRVRNARQRQPASVVVVTVADTASDLSDNRSRLVTTRLVIASVAKRFKEVEDQWVVDGMARVAKFQVPLGHIGLTSRVIDQNVVPGLLPGRLVAFPIDLEGVTGVVSLACGVVANYHSAIAVANVVYNVSRSKEHVFGHTSRSILCVGPSLLDPQLHVVVIHAGAGTHL